MLIVVQVSCQFSIIMNHCHHHCYILFMILLEYCHHPLPWLQHQDHPSYNVASTIDVIKCIQQYIVQMKLIKNTKKMMTTIILFILSPLYIMILSSNSTSITMKRKLKFLSFVILARVSDLNNAVHPDTVIFGILVKIWVSSFY